MNYEQLGIFLASIGTIALCVIGLLLFVLLCVYLVSRIEDYRLSVVVTRKKNLITTKEVEASKQVASMIETFGDDRDKMYSVSEQSKSIAFLKLQPSDTQWLDENECLRVFQSRVMGEEGERRFIVLKESVEDVNASVVSVEAKIVTESTLRKEGIPLTPNMFEMLVEGRLVSKDAK